MKKNKKEWFPPVVSPHRIITYGDPQGILLRTAEPVTPAELKSRNFEWKLAELLKTCEKNALIGISAPQTGWSKQVIVIWIKPTPTRPHLKDRGPMVLVNPRIDISSAGKIVEWEGCGSLPDIFARVSRSKRVEVGYTPHEGRKRERQSVTLDGLKAVIAQHEIDHLNGISFLERCDLKTVVTGAHYRRIREEEMAAKKK